MALSGSVTTPSNHKRSLTLYWTATQDTVNNKSTISWTLQGSGSYSGWVKVHEVKVTIDGNVTYIKDANVQCYGGSKATVVTRGNLTLSHNATTGQRSFTIKVEAGIYNSAINCRSDTVTFTLNQIILGSTITNASNITLGDNCSVQWTPTSSSYYYKLIFSLGNWSHIISPIHPNQTTTYTYSGYQIPLADIAPIITTSRTGTMTASLYTYSDSAMTNQRGVVSSKTFTVTVPSTTAPTLTNIIVVKDNSSNATVDGWDVAVAGYTKLSVSATAGTSYGATISSYTLSGTYSGTTDSLPYTGGKVASSGNKTISLSATDSRGYTSSSITSSAIYFYPYKNPEIGTFTVERTLSEYSGARTAVSIKGAWTFSSVGNKNTITPKLYYKAASSSSWIEYTGITLTSGTEMQLYAPLGGDNSVGFSELSAYDFKLEITDALSSKSQSLAFVPTRAVLLDFKAGGKGLGIGRFVETDRLEIGMETVFSNSIKVIDFGVETTLENYIYSIAKSLSVPQIIVQPESFAISLGDTITVSVKARGVDITYQWYYKKVNQSEWAIWNGRTHASETVTPNDTWDGIQLYCVITDSAGNSANSNSMMVTFNQ